MSRKIPASVFCWWFKLNILNLMLLFSSHRCLHALFSCLFFLFAFADDANDHQEGVSGKLSTGQHHRSCSSEEELTSINSCDNRLSSLTLVGGSDGGEGEYNGPFQGRAVALVDCTPSPYDRHALRYKVIIFSTRVTCW